MDKEITDWVDEMYWALCQKHGMIRQWEICKQWWCIVPGCYRDSKGKGLVCDSCMNGEPL